MAMGKDQVSEQASEALSQAKLLQQVIGNLRTQLRHQQALTQAIWTLIRQKLEFGDDELARIVQEIESLQPMPRKADLCASCNRPLPDTAIACIYCGAKVERRQLF
jgi:DNA-directed RNA polymerase specialized sigma54-like protein